MWRVIPYSTMANFSGKHLILSVLYLCHRVGIRYQWRCMWRWQKRVSPWWWSESSSILCRNAGNALDLNYTLHSQGISFSKWSAAHFFQCDWSWTCYPIYFSWDKYLVFMYIGQICVILCMPPRIVYKNPPTMPICLTLASLPVHQFAWNDLWYKHK